MMRSYLIVTEHPVQYTYMVDADNLDEAIRQVKENEAEGELTDEGNKVVISAEESKSFEFTNR